MIRDKSLSKLQIIGTTILVLLFFTVCRKVVQQKTLPEPLSVGLIDISRIDNPDVRHIFKEFLLKSIVDKGEKYLTLFDLDTAYNAEIQGEYIKYLVSFDIMDYGTYDIEKNTNLILVSVKILDAKTNSVIASFIESSAGRTFDQICNDIIFNLSEHGLFKKLSSLQKQQYQMPDVLSTPGDTTRNQ